MENSKRLIIFEGPDGAGKTTAARQLANDIGAVYTHLGPFPRIKDGLARLYIEAMMPAILGHRDVVLDRCWFSEVPYGRAFRLGEDRIGIRSRILERLAWRCQTTLVWCLPQWEKSLEIFKSRKGVEYLDNENQLRSVYEWYSRFTPDLPTIYTDTLSMPVEEFSRWIQDELVFSHTIPHFVDRATSGNTNAKVILVGEGFGDTAEGDPLYQSPFASVVESGCSLWLARKFEEAGIREKDLFWINADQLTPVIKIVTTPVIALGAKAGERLCALGRTKMEYVQHPQHWKRFHNKAHYELISLLKDITNA